MILLNVIRPHLTINLKTLMLTWELTLMIGLLPAPPSLIAGHGVSEQYRQMWDPVLAVYLFTAAIYFLMLHRDKQSQDSAQ
ncbi:hypothetical protein [Arthrobacter sp. SLBN-122]|uniref:hypothetical protein n=1 Tax=Arthrobacter sp. SLBN-122 TaxID=2768455 RepID=UPI00115323C7|nr:hypothetical protein [Arthrobacter sp. SLBN-122]TQJ35767.1 hypothetical protein FBY36_3046 [Arthrobacter sp. SLBN-122]